MTLQRKKVKDKETKQSSVEKQKKQYKDQINKLDNSINLKNNVLKDAAGGALNHYLLGGAFNTASITGNAINNKLGKAKIIPLKKFAGYGAAREVGAHAINKIKPDMPYEAKYGLASAVSSPLLAPKAMLSSAVPLPKKLAFSIIAGILGAGTSYLNKKDIQMTKKSLNKKMEKLNKKSAKDADIIPFIQNTANVTISKASQNNKISKLILKNPKAVGALVGLAILAGIGKFAYSKHKRNSAQDADVSGNNLVPLGKKVTEIITTYKPKAESGFLQSIKSLIMKYPKTTALIAGTAVATAGMSLRNNKKEKGK